MSLHKRITAIIIYLCFSVIMLAQQQTFSGKVTDAAGKALGNVSVLLINEKGNNVKFTRTDKAGNFSISSPEGKTVSKIGFVYLGYARQDMTIETFKKGNKEIKMSEKVQEIKEVEVRPELFRIKGDTIAYSVAGLREKQDRSIEDVISRIPGIKISTNGTIIYRGKSINKFYVDGNDMAGDSYAMVSKNLSADKVDSVEVLQNHQPVNALRGKSFSDAAAINLVLKPGTKFRWTGTAEVGSGAALQKPWQWDRRLRFVEMYFGNKTQSINIYKHNNIGEDILKELGPLGYNIGESSKLSNFGGIGTGRYGFNNTHLLATNWHTNIKKHTDIRLQFAWIFDKSTSHNYSERSYLDIANGAKVTEERSSVSYTNQWKAELNYNYNGPKCYVMNQLGGTLNYDHSHSSTLFNGAEKYERVLPRKRSLTDRLSITLVSGKKVSQDVFSEFSYNYMPGKLRLYNATDERLNQKAITWNTSYNFRYNLSNNLTARTSITYDMERKTEFVAYNDTIGSTHYKKDMIEIAPSLNYHINNFNANLTYDIAWLSRSLTTDKDRRWVSTPTINLSWMHNLVWNIFANYRHTFTPSGFEETDPLRVYSSYNYATSGTGKNNHSSGDLATININYQQPGYGWNGSLGYSYNTRKYNTLYESTLIGGVYIRESMSEANRSKFSNIQGSIGRKFRHWHTDISLSPQYGWRNYKILYDGKKTDSEGQNFAVTFKVKMRPNRIFNFEESSMFNLDRQSTMERTTLYRNFSHKLDLFLTPGNFVIAMKNECRHSADGSEKFSLFSDASCSYKTQKYELKLSCNNLWGTNKREYKSITTLGTSYSITELRPREIMACVTFDL